MTETETTTTQGVEPGVDTPVDETLIEKVEGLVEKAEGVVTELVDEVTAIFAGDEAEPATDATPAPTGTDDHKDA